MPNWHCQWCNVAIDWDKCFNVCIMCKICHGKINHCNIKCIQFMQCCLSCTNVNQYICHSPLDGSWSCVWSELFHPFILLGESRSQMINDESTFLKCLFSILLLYVLQLNKNLTWLTKITKYGGWCQWNDFQRPFMIFCRAFRRLLMASTSSV